MIGCEDRLRNDLYCVEWGVKLYSNSNSLPCVICLSCDARAHLSVNVDEADVLSSVHDEARQVVPEHVDDAQLGRRRLPAGAGPGRSRHPRLMPSTTAASMQLRGGCRVHRVAVEQRRQVRPGQPTDKRSKNSEERPYRMQAPGAPHPSPPKTAPSSSENRPAPFPGRMSKKATKHGFSFFAFILCCSGYLQCSDTVGWAAGRASGL